MNSIAKTIQLHKNRLLLAIFVGLGLLFSLQILKDHGATHFLVSVVCISIIMLLEIYANWRYATRVLRQIDMPNVNIYNLWGHLLNHIVLPLLLYYSVAGFVFYNDDDLIRLVAIALFVGIYLVLLVNIRAYYMDEFKTEEETRYIFDVIKLSSFFLGVNLILHIMGYAGLPTWLGGIFICFLAIGIGLLLILRKAQHNMLTVMYVLVTSFIIAIVFMIVTLGSFMLLGVNIILFLLFYFIYAILHHRLDRTLTIETFIEYCLILIIAVLIFWGIS